jgi:hypothetical protein
LIDWLLFNVQRAIFSYIQDEHSLKSYFILNEDENNPMKDIPVQFCGEFDKIPIHSDTV